MNDIYNNTEYTKRLGYGSGPFGSYGFGGQGQSLASCPMVPKYFTDEINIILGNDDRIQHGHK